MNLNTEPLSLLIKKYNFDPSKIAQISTGEKYTAVLFSDGSLGVSANLGVKVNTSLSEYQTIKINEHAHRIVLNAYFNAWFTSENDNLEEGDIFQVIDFRKFNNITMVGFFKPIVEKFEKAEIPLHIFDYRKEHEKLLPMSEQLKSISQADSIILTSTSLANNTFSDIVNASNNNCEIYLLGPSSIVTEELFNFRNIKIIFGSKFNNNDTRVLKIIEENGGTRSFSKYTKKVFLTRK